VEAKSFTDYSLEELITRAEKLQEAMEAPATDPREFYTGQVAAAQLLTDLRRYSLRHGRTNEVIRLEVRVAGMSQGMRMTRVVKYEEKFGRDAMRAAGEEVFHGKTPFAVAEGNVPAVPRTDVNWAWLIAYLQSVLLAPFFYCVRLRREGMHIAVEIGNILALMWVWPVAIFYYPTWIDVEAQARRAKLWAAYAFSALVSLLPFGSMAKAQGVGKDGRPVYSLIETVRDRYLNIAGVDLYPNTVSVTELKVSWRDWEVGVRGFKGLGKRNFSRHSLGNEINLFAGWKRKWADWLETQLGLAYHMNDFPLPGGGIEMARDDQIMLDARVSFPNLIRWVTPYLSYRYFGAVGKSSPHSGSFGWLGFQRQQPFWLFGREAPLSLDLQLAFSDGALGKKGKDGGFIYGRLNLLWLFKLTENLSFGPQILWLVADGSQHGGPRDYVEGRYAFGYGFRVQQQW